MFSLPFSHTLSLSELFNHTKVNHHIALHSHFSLHIWPSFISSVQLRCSLPRITSMFKSRKHLLRTVRVIDRYSFSQHRFCSSSFVQKKIEMPKFMDADIGCVEKWLKKEGECFEAGETVCEVTIDGVTLGIDHSERGVIAEILVEEEADVPVGKSLAIVVDGVEDYEAFVAKFKKLDEESEEQEKTSENSTTTEQPTSSTTATANQTSNLTLIKIVKHLIKTDAINEEDDFAHDLLSLCRQHGHSNTELLEAFDASYDGDEFNEETFEPTFFIQNARTIVAKHNIEEAT